MHPRFEQALHTYNEIAKDRMNPEPTPDDEENIEHVLRWQMKKQANRRETSLRTQKKIYDIQEQKQELMQTLHEELRRLDDPEYQPKKGENERTVIEQDGKFFWEGPHNTTEDISFGELLTDPDWGVGYYLDPNSVSRNVRKRYLIEQTKRTLGEYLDRQIATDAIGSERTHEFTRGAYKAVTEHPEAQFIQSGHIAERMVQNFLTKLSLDHDTLDFTILHSDIFQDVQQKVDFIIRRRRYFRGVRVNEDEEKNNVGIQFTIDPTPARLEHKLAQVARAKEHLGTEDTIEDIVLISIPIENTRLTYDRWVADGKKPGGPDKLWSRQLQQDIFKKILRGMFKPDELEQEWRKVQAGA